VFFLDDLKDKDKGAQRLIVVDASGKPTGAIVNRWEAHLSPGVKHLAFQVLVFNKKKELILHRRPDRKVGGNVLDAPVSHVLEGETKEQAIQRDLMEEYGISKKLSFVHLPGFSYEKCYDGGHCENEFCLVSLCVFDGKIKPNKKEAEEIVVKPLQEILEDLKRAPGNYPPWLHLSIETLLREPAGKEFLKD
jgi:isopentenyldiphosphate isomerase